MRFKYKNDSRPYPLNVLDAVKAYATYDRDAVWEDPIPGDLNETFDKALSHVREQSRQVIVMKFQDGMSYDEIGAKLDRSRENCRQNLCKGLAQLRCRPACDILRTGAVAEQGPGMHNLPAPIRNAFRRRGILSLEAVTKMTYRQVCRIPNIGRKHMEALMAEMRAAGLSFKPEDGIPESTLVSCSRLSNRTKNILAAAGITDLARLDGKPELELLAIENLGKNTLQEVRAELLDHGLDIVPYIPD